METKKEGSRLRMLDTIKISLLAVAYPLALKYYTERDLIVRKHSTWEMKNPLFPETSIPLPTQLQVSGMMDALVR